MAESHPESIRTFCPAGFSPGPQPRSASPLLSTTSSPANVRVATLTATSAADAFRAVGGEPGRWKVTGLALANLPLYKVNSPLPDSRPLPKPLSHPDSAHLLALPSPLPEYGYRMGSLSPTERRQPNTYSGVFSPLRPRGTHYRGALPAGLLLRTPLSTAGASPLLSERYSPLPGKLLAEWLDTVSPLPQRVPSPLPGMLPLRDVLLVSMWGYPERHLGYGRGLPGRLLALERDTDGEARPFLRHTSTQMDSPTAGVFLSPLRQTLSPLQERVTGGGAERTFPVQPVSPTVRLSLAGQVFSPLRRVHSTGVASRSLPYRRIHYYRVPCLIGFSLPYRSGTHLPYGHRFLPYRLSCLRTRCCSVLRMRLPYRRRSSLPYGGCISLPYPGC